MIKARFGNTLIIVTPGVRPEGTAKDDQVRVVTPAKAIMTGANHIVVGRPIIGAPNPGLAAANILREIANVG